MTKAVEYAKDSGYFGQISRMCAVKTRIFVYTIIEGITFTTRSISLTLGIDSRCARASTQEIYA